MLGVQMHEVVFVFESFWRIAYVATLALTAGESTPEVTDWAEVVREYQRLRV